ncbi:hypothetical protein IJ843_07375, partial [bacterium]|nr:hypothetical protein [bacterium]
NTGYILADGTYIAIGAFSIDASQYYSGAKYVGSIDVDIDGKNKGKDAYGYDRFVFDITDQGIYPEGLADNDLTSLCFVNGYCTRWVIENGNMDYLKVGSDGKCPDGKTILSWTNTTCK